jgi:hypothetical protein
MMGMSLDGKISNLPRVQLDGRGNHHVVLNM